MCIAMQDINDCINGYLALAAAMNTSESDDASRVDKMLHAYSTLV